MKTVNGLPQELDSDSEYSMGTSGVRVRGRADVIVRACVRVCACACVCVGGRVRGVRAGRQRQKNVSARVAR